MSSIDGLFPKEIITSQGLFLGHGGELLTVHDTNFHEYIKGILSKLTDQDIIFSDEEFIAIYGAAALLDALTKTRLNKSPDSDTDTIESGHHAFNLFYKAPGSDIWQFQYANSAYLANIGVSLEDVIGMTDMDLMQLMYTTETIEGFEFIAKKSQSGGYIAKEITMDKLLADSNGKRPTYIWYRNDTFEHPNGGKIQVRIGMDVMEASGEQKEALTNIYKLASLIRAKNSSLVYHSSSCSELISRLKNQTYNILENPSEEKNDIPTLLNLIRMVLEISADIVEKSPLPLTIIDEKGVTQQVSPTYAVMTGHEASNIIQPGFFRKVYLGLDEEILQRNLDYFTKHGRYPPETILTLTRGTQFKSFESEYKLNIPRTIGVIPQPFQTPDGTMTVRLNSMQPPESIAHLLKN